MDLSHESVLNDELRSFSKLNRLSDREQEVLYLLVQGYTSSESISRTLEISPNTTNNHVKSILDKTGTSSKTELLSAFLKNVMGHYTGVKLLSKKPKVLIVGRDAAYNKTIGDKLTALGVDIFFETDEMRVLELIPILNLDFILADATIAHVESGALIREVRTKYPNRPLFFLISAATGRDGREAVMLGAAAGFSKDCDCNTIYFRILELYVDSTYDRSRLVRANVDLPVRVQENLNLKMSNLSFGGAFIPLEKEANWKGLKLDVGDQLAMSFQLEHNSKEIEVGGEVAWKRPKSRIGKPAGFGVRFVKISEADKETVHSFVRLSKIRDFLPTLFAP